MRSVPISRSLLARVHKTDALRNLSLATGVPNHDVRVRA